MDGDADPVAFTTIEECSEKCMELSSMFAYGTNDFGEFGCVDGRCKCLCINSDDEKTCDESINQEQYWLYKFKNVGKL